MSVVELHPEELIDRASRGELAASDRARLDAHLSGCSVCRFELEARLDFAEDLELPASRDSGQIAAVLGRAALAAASTEVASPEPDAAPVEPRRSSRPRRRAPRVLLACAAVVLFASGALALNGAGFFGSQAPPVVPPPDPPPPAMVEGPVHGQAVKPAPVAQVPEAPAASSAAEPPPPEPPRPTSSRPDGPRPGGAADAARVFAEANEARRRGDVERAVALYRELDRKHPDSDEAKVARATVGRLMLERGDATGALDRYDAYLDRSRGALTEDAMVGRADALARLGRSGEEAAAWRELLSRFPGSAHAPRARARLAELGAR